MSSEQWAGFSAATRATPARPRGSASATRCGAVPVRARDPDAPGPGRGEDPVQRARGPGKTIPNNTHFDTTRANVEFTGARRSTCRFPEALVPSSRHPFKGDMDVEALRRVLAERDVPVVFMTLTNNSGGGQPVSMANLRAVREACASERAAVPRRLPLRRERLVREAARGRVRRHPGTGDRPRDGRRLPTG